MKQEKVIDLRGKRMGGPTPLICSPLVARTPERLAAETAAVLTKRPDVIEWRVDFFEPIADTAAVIAAGRALRAAVGETPIIFTCRAQHEGGQAVALDAEGIARLYDGGLTTDGAPYLVMEYVEGEDLLAHCARREMGLQDRLGLFVRVCDAVSYAHRHLVVHRDLKPSNILVTPEGEPKLLDFGLAKLTKPWSDSGAPAATVTSLRWMTPEYASPEQVEGRHATTVSDVYALGVVLYELLTGRSPYRLRSRTPQEVVEAVRTTDPERPSQAGDDEKVRRRLRGDLDTILLTALRKEPARR